MAKSEPKSKSESATLIPPEPRVAPWCAREVEQLRKAWREQRLPHALLIQGANGLGKREFSAWLAAAVLCERSTSGSLDLCGECPSCKLIAARTHPDLLWLTPEEGKQQISIDQVRDATDRLSRTSFRQGYKVAVIEPAHQMTINATNSLLKTLEEPSPPSLLILITSQPSSLLATVRSRCQKITVSRPSTAAAMQWLAAETGAAVEPALLEFAGGAPMRALEYAGGKFEALNGQMQKSLTDLLGGRADVTQIAGEWEKEGLTDRLVWLDLWLTSQARVALTGTADRVTFTARSAPLPIPQHALNISGLYGLVDRVRALKAQLVRTALQRELAVESLLIALLEVLAPPSAPAREHRRPAG